MHWFYLFAAIALEVSGTTCMKLSDGFSRLWPSIGVLVFYCASIACLTMAVKNMEISIAYAIWSAVGIALITLIGAIFFQESLTLQQLFFIAVIIFAVVGLKMTGHHQ